MRRSLHAPLAATLLVTSAGCQAPDIVATRQALAISSLEVNQAIGVQYQNAGKYVAGKDTVIIAILDGPTQVNPNTQNVTVSRGGQVVTTLPPLGVDGQTQAIAFACPSREQCGNWAEGDYTFTASIDGVTRSTQATFVVRRPMRVLAVPLTVNYGNLGGVQTPDDKWKGGGDFMRRTWPVASDQFSWTPRELLDLSSIDISTSAGQREVWQQLANLNPPQCTSDPSQAGCYDKIIGFIKARIGSMQGYTYGNPANVVVNDDEDMMGTVAHECGHPFQLGDEYAGGSFNCEVNPTPPNYQGKDFATQSVMPYSCTNSTEMGSTVGGTGVAIFSNVSHPFEVGGRGPLPDVVNFMGSGAAQALQWISPRTYDNLFNRLAPTVAPMAVGRVLELEGSWDRDTNGVVTVTKKPWFSYTGLVPPDTMPTGADELFVQVLDGGGATIATQKLDDGFEPITDPPASGPPQGDVFHTAIALPAAAAKLQIKKGSMVLDEVTISASAPTVTLTAPAGGGTISGESEISWTVSDSDGAGTFSSNVEYSPDNGTTWLEIATNVAGASGTLMKNFDDLPGSSGKALIRVTTTDGVNTGSATSAPFSVAIKAPEVDIVSPASGATLKAGQTLWLEVYAFDEQDGELESSSAVKWTSDRDGALGGGALLGVSKLSAGTHTISVTATNSQGTSTSKSVSVTVTAKASSGGCAVAGPTDTPAWPLWLVVLGLAALRLVSARARHERRVARGRADFSV